MCRSTALLLTLGAVFVAATIEEDAFEGEDLSHLLTENNLLEPEIEEESTHHGDWNAALLARSPHYTKRVREASGHEYDLTYYDTGDANITHGDIALPLEFTEHLQSHADHEVAGIHMLGAVQTSTRSIWPCPIPYVNSLDTRPDRVDSAIAHIERYTNFRFVRRTNERDYLDFVPSSGCSSFIGRVGGRQGINLARGCGTGSTVHEIMHAMGIFHEQSRPDRDNFVRINNENIQQGTQGNFRICRGCTTSGDYDCKSVMHYSANAFSINRQPTITNIGCTDLCRPGQLGQRNGLTRGDVQAIMDRFNPNSGCSGGTTPPDYNFNPCNGRTIAPGQTTTRQTTTRQTTTTREQTTQPAQTTQPTTRTTTRQTTTTQPEATRPVVTLPGPTTPEPPVTEGCEVSPNTAHQGFPYRNAIAQIMRLPNSDACCDRCTNVVECQSWTYLRQRGYSFCLLYRTPLSGQAYRGVRGYTSGSRPPPPEPSSSSMPFIAGGVAAAGAVVGIGGAAFYKRSKGKKGKKAANVGYSDNAAVSMDNAQPNNV